MVPLDDEILDLIDHIIEIRWPGRPLPHQHYRRPANSCSPTTDGACPKTPSEPNLTGQPTPPGLGHTTPHQLRRSYATALVNAGVSLQSLMALLGHASAEMSLRYRRLFDTTVRDKYQRALTLPDSAPVGPGALIG